jgi:hypothetical protein
VITAHRRAHRMLHWALWPLAIAVFGVALMGRRPEDSIREWPAFLTDAAAGAAANRSTSAVRFESEEAFGPWPARLRVFADASIELQPLRPLDRPELLLYWSRDPVVDSLPRNAHLLGRISGTHASRFALPTAAMRDRSDGSGVLVVYSLGHQAIVASARLEPDRDAEGLP